MALNFREAQDEDLIPIIRWLADDPLGQQRERFEEPLPASYLEAFAAVTGDPNHQILIVESDGELSGFLQLSFLPNLTYQGSWRALVEGVRVDPKSRGQGLGKSLLEEAIRRARAKGCRLIQLTTDKRRPAALAFYESLGFISSHEGMKLTL